MTLVQYYVPFSKIKFPWLCYNDLFMCMSPPLGYKHFKVVIFRHQEHCRHSECLINESYFPLNFWPVCLIKIAFPLDLTTGLTSQLWSLSFFFFFTYESILNISWPQSNPTQSTVAFRAPSQIYLYPATPDQWDMKLPLCLLPSHLLQSLQLRTLLRI